MIFSHLTQMKFNGVSIKIYQVICWDIHTRSHIYRSYILKYFLPLHLRYFSDSVYAYLLLLLCIYRSSRPEVFCKKGVLRNLTKSTGKHLCQSLFLKACNFIKKETLAQLLSCEFCQISKSTFLHRTPLMAASVSIKKSQK